jgi:hypothetical protein
LGEKEDEITGEQSKNREEVSRTRTEEKQKREEQTNTKVI